MAGEWLKMEACTPEKAEVLMITARMGWDDADTTVGKLFRVWRWFDQHTLNGNAVSVTSALLDRIIGVSGFCHAMQSVGWLVITEEGISLPNFDRHNGNTAKNRVMTAKRVANHKSNAKGNGASVTSIVSAALAREREEKEKEKNKKNTTPEGVSDYVWQDFLKVRAAKKAPMTQTALELIVKEAAKAGWTLEEALAECSARGWRSFKAEWIDKPVIPGLQRGDMARMTTPSAKGRDPALIKLDQDAKHTGPPPAEIMAKIKLAVAR